VIFAFCALESLLKVALGVRSLLCLLEKAFQGASLFVLTRG
jgi:hypothetical protein